MTVGERIRQRRLEMGLTQEELAKKLGYTSRTAISNVEKNKEDLTTARLQKFADALEVPPSFLMGWTKEDYDRASEKYHIYSAINNIYMDLGYDFYYIADAYNELPIEGKNELRNYIDYLLTKYNIQHKILNEEDAASTFLDKYPY